MCSHADAPLCYGNVKGLEDKIDTLLTRFSTWSNVQVREPPASLISSRVNSLKCLNQSSSDKHASHTVMILAYVQCFASIG